LLDQSKENTSAIDQISKSLRDRARTKVKFSKSKMAPQVGENFHVTIIKLERKTSRYSNALGNNEYERLQERELHLDSPSYWQVWPGIWLI
jgi:hypothetical protein